MAVTSLDPLTRTVTIKDSASVSRDSQAVNAPHAVATKLDQLTKIVTNMVIAHASRGLEASNALTETVFCLHGGLRLDANAQKR